MAKKQQAPKEPEVTDQTPNGLANDQKIDAIKEIIFGANMQQYEQEFTSIKELIQSLKEETFQKIDALKSTMEETFDNLEKDMNNRIDGLEADMTKEMERVDDAKLDRHLMGDMLRQIADKIQA